MDDVDVLPIDVDEAVNETLHEAFENLSNEDPSEGSAEFAPDDVEGSQNAAVTPDDVEGLQNAAKSDEGNVAASTSSTSSSSSSSDSSEDCNSSSAHDDTAQDEVVTGHPRRKPRRAKLSAPSYRYGPFRMTFRHPKAGTPSKGSWQMTCPFHCRHEKTKCTRSLTFATDEGGELGQLRLKYWALRGYTLATREEHQAFLKTFRSADMPNALRELPSIPEKEALHRALDLKLDTAKKAWKEHGSSGSSSTSSASAKRARTAASSGTQPKKKARKT
eukprot:3416435-Amphidinium_carterae.1